MTRYGRYWPKRDRVRATMIPISGSETPSQIIEIRMTMPASAGLSFQNSVRKKKPQVLENGPACALAEITQCVPYTFGWGRRRRHAARHRAAESEESVLECGCSGSYRNRVGVDL